MCVSTTEDQKCRVIEVMTEAVVRRYSTKQVFFKLSQI